MVSANTSSSAYVARLAEANGFEREDLQANRQGTLTPAQRQRLGIDSRVVLIFAAIFAAIGVAFGVVAVATWHLGNGVGTGTAAVAAACLLVAAATVTRSRQVRNESAAPHIALYEGLIIKQTSAQVPPARARTAGYFYTIEGAHLPVSPEAYEVLDEAIPYRVYYLARTQQLLSMEPMTSGSR
jgi:membrane protein YdbS with pleckstrin-like domain